MPQDYVPMPPLRWRLFMYILIDVGYLGQILTIKRPKYPMYLADLPLKSGHLRTSKCPNVYLPFKVKWQIQGQHNNQFRCFNLKLEAIISDNNCHLYHLWVSIKKTVILLIEKTIFRINIDEKGILVSYDQENCDFIDCNLMRSSVAKQYLIQKAGPEGIPDPLHICQHLISELPQ